MATDTRDDTILVCSDDPAVLAALPALGRLGYGAARCATLPELRHALQRPALAVVLDLELEEDEAYAIRRFLALDRRTPFLALRPAPGSEQAAWRPAWSAELGHAEHEEVARKPLSTDELCLRLHALLLRCGALPPRALDFWGASRAAPGRRAEGRVVCVFGAKGGVGKTTVAVHLAVGLATLAGAEVALVDGDLWSSAGLLHLDLTAPRTILDVVRAGVPDDPELWTRALVSHPSGVRVLAPPEQLTDVEQVPPEAVAAAARGLRAYADYVVVDLDATLSESNLNALGAADEILLVLTPELIAVRNARRLLSTLGELGLGPRVRLVLNRCTLGLEASQVEAVLQAPIVARIPGDGRLFVAAVNTGLTLFETPAASQTPAWRALEALVREVAVNGRPAEEPRPRRGLLATLAALAPRLRGRPAPAAARAGRA